MEVVAGTTPAPKTFKAQIDKRVQCFGVKRVSWVGDRGMIKTGQISDLKEAGFHSLTAITKPQIQALLKTELLRLAMFEVRDSVRGNPQRADERAAVRQSKRERLDTYLAQKNAYLADPPHAKVETALKPTNSSSMLGPSSTWRKEDSLLRSTKAPKGRRHGWTAAMGSRPIGSRKWLHRKPPTPLTRAWPKSNRHPAP
ncbi:MAG TPA: hypothetical protein VE844_01700 [Gammaproteobacteria bacterium]|nr:hypothetical protein [Gammaproteobacteria bacterium]